MYVGNGVGVGGTAVEVGVRVGVTGTTVAVGTGLDAAVGTTVGSSCVPPVLLPNGSLVAAAVSTGSLTRRANGLRLPTRAHAVFVSHSTWVTSCSHSPAPSLK